jgi:MFS family permease
MRLGLPRTLASLRQRNFRRFWSGQLVSLIGSDMQSLGQAWLVMELTDSPWQLGLVGALQALPILFFSLFGGILADRWPKRPLLLVSQTAAALQAFVLWVLIVTGAMQLWHLYTLAFFLGLTNSLSRPARQAFVVELVDRDKRPNAVALNSSLNNLARIVGPAFGGIIIAATSVTSLFLLNALSFLPLIVALALIRSRELHVPAQQRPDDAQRLGTLHSVRDGLSYIRRTPAVLLVISVVGLVLLFGSNFGVVLPFIATDILQAGPQGLGFLSTASGVGALAATLWLAWRNRQPIIRSILLSGLAFGLLEALFAFSRSYPLSLVLFAAVACAEIAFAVRAITWLQVTTPDHLRGRVMSVHILFFDGSLPLGYVLIGWLTDAYGPAAALLVGAVLSLLVTSAGWLWYRALRLAD